MTIRLTQEQSALWELGGWDGFRVEESIIETLEANDITEQVIVELDNGAVAFAVIKGGVA